MDTASGVALTAGDRLVAELTGAGFRKEALGGDTPTMGKLQKVRYTHDAMIELILKNGDLPAGQRLTQKQIAEHFGYTEGWISNILASDAFQVALEARRQEVVDPEIAASIKERFAALTIQSLKVLQQKLSAETVSDNVALRAAELGAKALGVGGHAPPANPEKTADRLERLAHRLIDLNVNARRTVNGEVSDAEVVEERPQLRAG